MKILAGTQQPFIGVEVVVEPIKVQVPMIVVPVEIRKVEVAIGIMPLYTKYHLYHCPLITLGAVFYLGY